MTTLDKSRQDVVIGAAQAEAVDYDPFADAPLARVVPTTEAQREVWLADQLGREASLAYNESIALQFEGALDIEALRGAIQDVVQRHEALRATVSANGEELHVAAECTVDVQITDCSNESDSDKSARVAQAKLRAVETPFALATGPLVRAEVLKLGKNRHLLIFTAHHIVCDGWSFAVIVRDLAHYYSNRTGNALAALPAAASFGDYAASQNAAIAGTHWAEDEAYWLSQYSTQAPALDLPTDRPRSAHRTFASRREDYVLGPELVADVRKMGARNGASLFATLLCGFSVLIQRISGSTDIVIGIPAAAQSTAGLDSLVGHCVNLLPLRLQVDPTAPSSQLISATQSCVLDGYEHQGYTFGSLLKKLALERDPSRLSLVSVMFNIDQALEAESMNFPGLKAEFAGNARSYENFELFVNAVQVRGGLRLECQYNADLFDAVSVKRWLKCYEMLLRGMCADAQCPPGKLPIVSEDDQQQLQQWNATAKLFSADALVHELIERQVARTPQKPAITWRGKAVSYAELDARANQIAHALRARGVGRGMLVGLYLGRGPDLIASLLGVLKAGAGYVPLDPIYPADRLAYMAEDAGLAMLLSEGTITPMSWARERTLLLDRDAAPLAAFPKTSVTSDSTSAQPLDVAYVIYTSGSTGKPKGVRVPHRSVVNFLESMAREPGLTEGDRIVAVTTLSFDIAVNELLLPLTVGAEVILAAADESGDGANLSQLIQSSRASVMQATPATWRLLLEAGWQGAAGFKALCGGEPLTADLASLLLSRTAQLWNMYGPTETTVWSTCCRIEEPQNISIGRPIANTVIRILDAARQICAIGVPGEIWIGGDGVTLGYLNRPELTAERFISDPFSTNAGQRLYQTGDRGRWRNDGLLQHMGRLDFQVKVRGYRIELGEIEACLSSHESIARSVVLAREDKPGDVRLVAYLVSQTGNAIDEDALRMHLKAVLPEYMVPQHFVMLREIPLLSNGKIDRKGLPTPAASQSAKVEYVAPRDDIERTVVAELEKVLGLPGVGIHGNFFSLGGHSLLAAQLIARLNKQFGTRLSIRTLFESPTAAQLAASVASQISVQASSAETASHFSIMRLDDQSRAPMSVMQERLWFLEELYPGRVNYHAPSAHRLTGLMNEVEFERAFNEMIRRQLGLRTCFERLGNTAVQRVEESLSIKLFPAEDLSHHLSSQEREAGLARRMDELAARPFDLTKAPLFSARMFRLGADEHVLFFMAHHIVWDGWSFDLLYEELSALYGAYVEKRTPSLPKLEVSYLDFAAWHRAWMKSGDFTKQLDFWKGRLGRIANFRELPTDFPRRPGMSGGGSTEWMVVEKSTVDSLHKVAQLAEATLSMTLLAAYCALLHGYSRQSNLVIGMPVRGRNTVEFEPIMGYFNNLLPLQVDLEPQETFIGLVKRVKATVVESFTYPDVPLEELGRELSSLGAEQSSLLYQALFSFQDARQRIKKWGGLDHQMVPIFQRGATEDLGVWFVEGSANMQGGITYNTDIFAADTAHKLHMRLRAILNSVAVDPLTKIDALVEPMQSEFRQWIQQSESKGLSTAKPELSTAGTAPVTDTEKQLADIWCAELKLKRVSLEDNFFDLGGHSLLAMQVMNAMETQTGKRVNPQRFIFETLGQIAKAYDDAQVQVAEQPGAVKRLFSKLLGKKS